MQSRRRWTLLVSLPRGLVNCRPLALLRALYTQALPKAITMVM